MLFPSASAHAMQPLSDFITSSNTKNFDLREADALHGQRTSEADASRMKLLPTLSARGVYTHNQYEAVARAGGVEAVISPQNQLDAFVSLDVPLIDFAAWARLSSSNALRDAANLRKTATALDAQLQVTQAYYQVLAARTVDEAARKSLEVAERNHKTIADRKAAGLSTELDLQRAVGEVERNKQRLANAAYLVLVTERQLRTLSGLAPTPGGTVEPDDFHEELPVATFLHAAETPSIEASRLEAQAQDKAAASQWRALLPSLSANATERFTNATGFANRSAYYTLSATLSWRLDASVWAQAEAQDAASKVAAVRQERAQQSQEDRIHNAWDAVKSSVAAAKAARAEAEASKLALGFATDRYQAGTALQLDVLDASRQAFQSEVTRIQAEADLAIARRTLHLLATRKP